MFLVESTIKRILVNGMDDIRADIDKLAEIFDYSELEDAFDSEDLEGFKNYIRSNKIAVRLSYPKGTTPLPCFSVTLGAMEEITKFQGDVIGREPITIDSKNYRQTNKGAYYRKTYKIMPWAKQSSELTILLFYLAHYLLFMNKGYLNRIGVEDVNFSGFDIEPAEQFYPEFVYTRPLMLMCQVPTIFEASREQLKTINSYDTVFDNDLTV